MCRWEEFKLFWQGGRNLTGISKGREAELDVQDRGLVNQSGWQRTTGWKVRKVNDLKNRNSSLAMGNRYCFHAHSQENADWSIGRRNGLILW